MNRENFWVLLLVVLFVGGCGNDSATSSSHEENSSVLCQDKADNDKDGFTDCEDQDCQSFSVCSGNTGANLTWISIPGGTFSMGSTTGTLNEEPVHEVTVPTFEITKTEITVTQYGECVTAGSCTVPSGGVYDNWGVAGYEDHPVNSVVWSQALTFCAWAGARLPSESEWEYAARSSGQDITYPWGNEVATCNYAIMSDVDPGCGTARTWAVCSKTAGNTDQGLCDMAGNVWEWVQDWHHSSYTGAPTDGSAWESPNGSDRVLRGGSFFDTIDGLRATGRPSYAPWDVADTIGLRCAR